ncbi:MAG: peptidoglycan-binding domain-containing protein [Clostridia bacterium]|jgi:peptidoglycan hydrolase-like protein with peptidoglycan-binding domain
MVMGSNQKWARRTAVVGISTMLLFSNTAMAAPLLKVGSRGEAVSSLQKKLTSLGYYNYRVTGYFGSITRDAVVRFQKSKGLQPDGIVGKLTHAALEGGSKGSDRSGSSGSSSSKSSSADKNTQATLSINRLLKRGSRGADVKSLQQTLKNLGYSLAVDGIFGPATEKVVRSFQKSVGITVDGIVGKVTIGKLQSKINASRSKDEERPAPSDSKTPPVKEEAKEPDKEQKPPAEEKKEETPKEKAVEMLSWSQVDKLFPRKSTAVMVDVDTGLKVNIYRYGGTLHADVEPKTSQDTATLKKIYGGQWSWTRRAVILEVGGRRIAASINGMPHGEQDIKNNNFDGQFCMHFLDSRVHSSNRVCPDHQAMVRKAAAVK